MSEIVYDEHRWPSTCSLLISLCLWAPLGGLAQHNHAIGDQLYTIEYMTLKALAQRNRDRPACFRYEGDPCDRRDWLYPYPSWKKGMLSLGALSGYCCEVVEKRPTPEWST